MDLNTQQEVHLTHYWNVIRKRWRVAAAIMVVVMTGAFLAGYFAKPLYRSKIQIEIERENGRITVEDIFGIAASDQEFLQTQYVLLRSRGLALRVIDDHKLLSDPEFYPPGIAGKTPDELQRIKESMAGALIGGVEVVPIRNTSLVDVFYTGTSPKLAQKIANAWGESFIRMHVSKKLATVQQANQFLTQQIATVQNDLEESRRQLQNYGQRTGIVSSSESGSDDTTLQKLTQLTGDVTVAQNDFYQKQATYNSLRRTSAESLASGDPHVQRLTEEVSTLQRKYSELGSQFLEGHPTMRSLRDQIDKARTARSQAVAQGAAKAIEAARADMEAASTRVASVRGAYESQRNQAQKMNVDAARYADLRMAVETKQALLGTLQKQLTETEVSARLSGSSSSNIHIIDPAPMPGGRINLSMQKNLQGAVPLGLVLGLGAIFFLEYMDRSIKSPEDLEKMTRFASLGVIPAAGSVTKQYGRYGYGRSGPLRAVENTGDKSGGIELIPHTDARSPISEAYRAFRTSLLLASASSPKVIVITSSFAREGKTTTSTNLATVLAQMGKPVVLVDADLRRPRIQKVFRGKMNLGLVNYLAANIPLDDIIQPSDVPNLSVILSGPTPPNPSELLSSDRMKHLIEELRGKFAYVIFDSPPVLAVTDAVVLAANADGVVLCVHGGHTPRDLVQRSAERLRQANIPVLGAILNNLDLQQYGYTYKKSYYDYYAEDEESRERKTVS